MSDTAEELPVSYEDLAELEKDFDEVETQILKQQNELLTPLYEKRDALVSQIPNFWPLVLEQAPVEIDQFTSPSDSAILTKLTKLSVSRFEISPSHEATPNGNPRSVKITMEFADNEWFDDKVLEKKFWFRRSKDGWSGLVSEPVEIHWKGGDMDLSEDLTTAAYNLWKAEKESQGKKREDLKEYKTLIDKMEKSSAGVQSFFTWFAFRGRDVSAEESDEAVKKEEERRQKIKSGEKVAADQESEADEEDVENLEGFPEYEVFPQGEEVAIALSEDVFPGAIKYFTQEMDDQMSDANFEGPEESEDDEMTVADLRKLVNAPQQLDTDDEDAAPPKKKPKKT